jgi:hypothetical protein
MIGVIPFTNKTLEDFPGVHSIFKILGLFQGSFSDFDRGWYGTVGTFLIMVFVLEGSNLHIVYIYIYIYIYIHNVVLDIHKLSNSLRKLIQFVYMNLQKKINIPLIYIHELNRLHAAAARSIQILHHRSAVSRLLLYTCPRP